MRQLHKTQHIQRSSSPAKPTTIFRPMARAIYATAVISTLVIYWSVKNGNKRAGIARIAAAVILAPFLSKPL